MEKLKLSNLEITNIHYGTREGREGTLYARLVRKDTGELQISATLDYIMEQLLIRSRWAPE